MKEAKVKYVSNDRQSELRRLRIEREEAQKSAGVWGEMSVALIAKDDSVFAYCLKGNRQPDLYSFAVKKPKDWEEAEYDALMMWLRANRFEGFTQSFAAWNLSQAESQRMKSETLAKLRNEGRIAINPAAAGAARNT
jgi:hypothetical protein